MKYPGFEQTAIELVNQYNVAVFPLNGKFPAIRKEHGGRGCLDATKDIEQIKQWAKRYPKANVGIATGPASGVVVIDIDDMNALSLLDLPETLTVKTGKGLHFYYQTNGHRITNSAKGMPQGVDVRGAGGYVVSPGSLHPDTNTYYKVEVDAPIREIPKHLLDQLLQQSAMDEKTVRNPEKYFEKVVQAAYRELLACPKGSRNILMNTKSFLLGRYIGAGFLNENEVVRALEEVAHQWGEQVERSLKTIQNGIKKGKDSPKRINVTPNFVPPPLKLQNIADDMVYDLALEEEIGDAKLFNELIKGRYLYDHFAQCWLTYYDGRWQRDLTGHTTQDCYDYLKAAYMEVAHRLDRDASRLRAMPASDNDADNMKEAKAIEKKRDMLRDRCKRLGSSKRLRNVLSLASTMASSLSTDFDNDHLLLNLKNGTFDLRRNEFRRHDSADMMTKMSDVMYDPDADCPNWELFVADICRDDWDRMMYLKKIAGLMLTGRNDYQYLFFCYGKGANGKSTFFKTLQRIISDFFITLPIDILLAKNKAAADEYHLARLKGSRVVMASEIPGNKRLNESLIKDLTSNDLLTARNPYERPFQYEPTHKLFIVGNHKPPITNMDHGLWRRIRLIPFDYQFPEEKRRPMNEVLAEFREEECGILRWMIEGYQMLLDEGLEMPEAVRAATQEYQSESDSIGIFLEESTRKVPMAFKVSLADLWIAYSRWCEENGERPSVQNNRYFGVALRERGLELRRSDGNKTFVFGIEILKEV